MRYGGRGEKEHVKIVHMGKQKPWSVAICNLHDYDHLLERSAMALAWRLVTGFPKAETAS